MFLGPGFRAWVMVLEVRDWVVFLVRGWDLGHDLRLACVLGFGI